MAPRKKTTDISDALRRAIQASGLTAYALAKASGVSSQQIGRFLADERELGLRAAGKLAGVLGLRLAPVAEDSEAHKPIKARSVQAITEADVLAAVKAHSKALRPARLADVFRALQARRPALTLGQFHDSIRGLATAGKLRLSAFTQAMYQLADPETCLLVGREIMAFAEVPNGVGA